jgi:hypothetical protein
LSHAAFVSTGSAGRKTLLSKKHDAFLTRSAISCLFTTVKINRFQE